MDVGDSLIGAGTIDRIVETGRGAIKRSHLLQASVQLAPTFPMHDKHRHAISIHVLHAADVGRALGQVPLLEGVVVLAFTGIWRRSRRFVESEHFSNVRGGFTSVGRLLNQN